MDLAPPIGEDEELTPEEVQMVGLWNQITCTITSLNNTWAICVRPNYRLINWNKCDKICKLTNELTLSENAEILNYFN